MKKGKVFKMFGCTWIVDDVYSLSDEYMRTHRLFYRNRYRAHVIEAPEGYKGIRELDCALRK